MRKHLAVFAVLATLLWLAPAALADHGDHGKGQGRGNDHHADRDNDRGHDRDHDRDYDRDRDRWERRDNWELRVYDVRGSRPPGWRHGEKTGWGNCGLPPGQAKKYGCRTYIYSGRRYYYYEDEVGRIIVRRPVIEINAVIR